MRDHDVSSCRAPGRSRAAARVRLDADARMTGGEMVAVVAAGFGAGAINTAVGSGSLLSFPVLVATGVPPVAATVTNSLGLIAGGLTGSFGYRREIAALRRWLPWSLAGAVLGALTGAWLLLHLPSETFDRVVPVLVVLAAVLVAVQPLLDRMLAHRRETHADAPASQGRLAAMGLGSYATSTYGGYFSASQGVLLMGIAGLISPQPLQRLNALKNVTTVTVNTVAAATYVIVAPDRVVWPVAALLTLGSLAGGVAGARVGRRLPPALLRGLIVALAVIALVVLMSR
jgi:uncharacterized protein